MHRNMMPIPSKNKCNEKSIAVIELINTLFIKNVHSTFITITNNDKALECPITIIQTCYSGQPTIKERKKTRHPII